MTTERKEEKLPTYRILGNSGLRVSPVSLGCMQFGEAWKEVGCACDETEAEKVLGRYFEAGGNFLDTAVNYQNGESERMIGKLVKKMGVNRDKLVIATKFTSNYNGSGQGSVDPNMVGNSAKNMYYSIDQSLKNLQMDYIDVLYVHWFGFCTPMKTLMRQLDDVVRSGKVRSIAISDTQAWRCSAMMEKSNFYGFHSFCAYQGKYSLIDRDIEQEIIPMCQEYDLGVVPWGVVGQGALSGVRSNEEMKRKGFVPKVTEKVKGVQEMLVKMGEERGRSAASVAMNWAMNKPGITSILVGARNEKQMIDTLKCMDFQLSKEEMGKLDEVSQSLVTLLFPQSFIGNSLETCGWYDFPKKSYNLVKKR